MKYCTYIFFLLCNYLSIYGQTATSQLRVIDSLKKVIGSKVHDTSKIAAYNAWDNLIYISNPKLDEELNQKIVNLAEKGLENRNLSSQEKYTYKKSLALALNSLGIIYYTHGEKQKAVDFYERSLKIRQELQEKKGIAATLNNLGIVFQDQADYKNAIDYYTQSLKINEEIGDKNGEANCLSNIGRIYLEQNEALRAVSYQSRSLEIRKELNDKRGMAIAYNNIAAIYSKLKETDKAIEYLKSGLELSTEINDRNKIALALGNLGIEYISKERNDEALSYLNQSIKMFKEIGDEKSTSVFLSYVGNVYKRSGDNKKAIGILKEALAIAQKTGHVSTIRDISQSLAEALKKEKKYEEALSLYELYTIMHDSLWNENNQREIVRKDLKYSYEKQKALAAKEHEKELAISFEKEQKQKIVIFAIALSFVLALAFSIFVVKRLRLTRRQKVMIERQKLLVEEKQKEIMASITYAKRLQEAMLPTTQYINSVLDDYFVFYKPKDIVAGDFYWIEKKKDRLFIAVADCTGHGIPGAIISVICSNALNRAVVEFNLSDPGKILSKTRELVLETFSRSDKDVKDGMDISLLSINNNTNEINWSGANIPLWYISDQKLIEIKANKQPIGKADQLAPFTSHSIPYKKGDVFFLFSDGYADQFGGPKGKKIKSKALKNVLLRNSVLPCSEQKNELEKIFKEWTGTLEQIDDVCVLGLRI